MERVTIAAVAARAGVSAATVSYVLNGKKKISEEISARVREAVDELGYQPNRAARNLASRRTWSIGFFGPSTAALAHDFFLNPLLAGVLDGLNQYGYTLTMVAESPSGDSPTGESALSTVVDGAIVIDPRMDHRYIESLEKSGVPFVIIGVPDQHQNYFFVHCDIIAAFYTAASYLLRNGRRRILLLNGKREFSGSLLKEKGYRMAHEERGLPIVESLVHNGELSLEAGEEAVRRHLADGEDFDAVLAFNDLLAVGAVRALRSAGLSVPGRVAVVGTGDTDLSRLHSPAITTIDLKPYQLGRRAVELLVDIVERRRIQATHTLIDFEFVKRDSA